MSELQKEVIGLAENQLTLTEILVCCPEYDESDVRLAYTEYTEQ